MMQDHRYQKQCYRMLKGLDDGGRVTWATKVKNLLFKYGFGFVWLSQEVGNVNAFIFQFRQRLTDCMRQDWHDKVNTSSRCDFYKLYDLHALHIVTCINTCVDLQLQPRVLFTKKCRLDTCFQKWYTSVRTWYIAMCVVTSVNGVCDYVVGLLRTWCQLGAVFKYDMHHVCCH
jgi:hypothetical protein